MPAKKIISISLMILFVATASAVFAQNVDDKKKEGEKKTVDIYKEFSETSFEDATMKVKDSTVLTQHLIGIKAGYSIAKVGFSQDVDHTGIKSPINFGIYYTYYHSLWNSMPFFGFQTGLEYAELGYSDVVKVKDKNIISEEEQRYQTVQLPLLSQFRVDFWKMRLMLNLGPYGYYITSTSLKDGIPETTNKAGIGIMGGGGLALVFKPVELHLECNYRYAMSHFCDPKIYSEQHWTYTHANQLTFSLGLFFRLGDGKKNKQQAL